MTHERERLVRAVDEASARQDAILDADTMLRYELARREYVEAENALAAYDAAHPEEAK